MYIVTSNINKSICSPSFSYQCVIFKPSTAVSGLKRIQKRIVVVTSFAQKLFTDVLEIYLNNVCSITNRPEGKEEIKKLETTIR